MAKKSSVAEVVKVKFTGKSPVNNIVTAKIAHSIMGSKVGFNHRYGAVVETGTFVEVPEGYKLCFRLVPSLANRGMLATNAPGGFANGEVFIHLLNSGREIVEVKDGDQLAELWIEKIIPFEWEA